MLITDAAIKNKTTIVVVAVFLCVFGIYSYLTLPREAAPDVPIPIILVNTSYEGVSPEDVETSVTMKIEKELTGLSGVKQISSSSAEGFSNIVIEFQPDVVIDDALQHVRDRVDQAKSELPSEADEPSVKEINIAEFPIMMVNISGGISPVQLKAMADELQDQLEAVPGVLEVNILGAPEREIRLEIDLDRVALYNLTIPELLALIPSENVNISAGSLETTGTKFNVRVPAEFVEPEEVDRLLLTVHGDRPIYLSDVARVTDTFKDPASISRLDGKETVTLTVVKRVGANIIEVSDTVKHVMEEARRVAPASVALDVTFDMSRYIRDMVADLENNMASALVLLIGCLFLFLGWRPSTIVSLVIPFSMLASFAIIQMIGYTLNMIVLFSLVLAVGMLVDTAIVIVENIYRHMEMGKSRLEAVIIGTREVAWPVTTSTFTNIAAFIPLAFWPGVMGSFMKYLPITVMIVLGSSLLVALTFTPTMSAVFAGHAPRVSLREHWFVRGYRKVQRIGLDHPLMTLFLSACLLVIVTLLYARLGHGVEFFPNPDPDRAIIDFRSPQGTNIREVDRIARLIEARLEPFRAEIKHVVSTVGVSGSAGEFGGGSAGPHLGNITVIFHDFELRRRPSGQVVADIRQAISDLPGAEIKVQKEEHGPPTGQAVEVRIVGQEFATLESLSLEAKSLISDIPGLVNLRSDLEATRPELVFRVDRRRAALQGVNTATIGNFLKMAVLGTKVGTYRQFNDEYDITLRMPLARRINIEDLQRLQVPNAAGNAVPLSSVGAFDYQGGFGTINRLNQKRVVTLTGDTEGRLGPEVLKDVQARLAKLAAPPGYEVRYAGQKEEEDKARVFLLRAFFIALMIIVVILVVEFNSVLVPLIIVSTVILSLIGVLIGLLVCDLPFSIIMTGIAVISLAGIVVNNGIVLLDFTQQLRSQGMGLVEATVEAGVTRLRPVLLSAVTNFIGLIPMAVGVSYDFHTFTWATKSQSSQWWNNMSIAMIFGLTFATILTLVVVPALYVTLNRLAERFGFGGIGAAKEATPKPPRTNEDA